jgi:hypothetical protein
MYLPQKRKELATNSQLNEKKAKERKNCVEDDDDEDAENAKTNAMQETAKRKIEEIEEPHFEKTGLRQQQRTIRTSKKRPDWKREWREEPKKKWKRQEPKKTMRKKR